jgi:hypothetical protein
MAKHNVALSDETWHAVENRAREAGIDPTALIEMVVSDRMADPDYVSDLLGELENDEAAEE